MKVTFLVVALAAMGCAQNAVTPEPASSPAVTQKTDSANPNLAVPDPTKAEPQKQPSGPPQVGKAPTRPVNNDRIYQLDELPQASIKFNGKTLKVWIMDTDSKRQEGMMFLVDKEVKPDEGMLFVFPDEQQRAFWMKNTLIPLDIAYIAKSGKTVSAHLMKALDERSVPSAGPAMYALEMKAGAFKRLGIRAGTTFQIPADIRAFE